MVVSKSFLTWGSVVSLSGCLMLASASLAVDEPPIAPEGPPQRTVLPTQAEVQQQVTDLSDQAQKHLATLEQLKGDLREWREVTSDLQTGVIASDEELAALQAQIEEKEQEVARLKRDLFIGVGQHEELAGRQEQRQAIMDRYYEEEQAYQETLNEISRLEGLQQVLKEQASVADDAVTVEE